MAAVKYQFNASGQDAVINAFRDVEMAANRSAIAAQRAKKAYQDAGKVKFKQPAGAEAPARTGDREVAMVRDTERRKAGERDKAQRHVAAIRDRYFAAEQRRQEQEVALERKKSAQTIAVAKQRAREMGGVVKSVIGSGVALSIGAIGMATRDAFRLSELANRLSISSRGAGEQAVDPRTLRKEFEATAKATPGVTAESIAEAVQGFVGKTGRLDIARQQQGTFATVASATGADVQDIANAAADLFQKFDVTSIDEMRESLAALAFQGKAGAFELKDAAGQFGRLSAAADGFNVGKGVKAVRTLGGLTQLSRSSTGGPEQAATAVEALFRQLRSEAKNIEKDTKGKVKVFKDKGNTQTEDITKLLPAIIGAYQGNQVKLQERFKDEGGRAVARLTAAYNTAAGGAVGKNGQAATEAEKVAAGMAAVNRMLDESINAQGGWSEITKDAAQAQGTASAKLTAAWEGLKATAADELVPALAELVPKLAPLAKVLGSAVTALASFAAALGKIVDMLPASLRASGDEDMAGRAAAAKENIAALEDTAKKRPLTSEETKALGESKKTLAETERKSKFVDDFVAANTSSLKTKRDLEIDAENFYQAAQRDPVAARAQADAIAKTTGGAPVPFLTTVNQAQADVVGGLTGDITAQRLEASGGKSGTTIGAEKVGPAVDTLVAAIKKAAESVSTIQPGNQPTTVHPG